MTDIDMAAQSHPVATRGPQAAPLTTEAAPSASDTLSARLGALDATLKHYESDANADADTFGEVYASVNVTALRVLVREAMGTWRAKREALEAGLAAAHHGLTTSHNLRATDLDHDTFAAHLGNDASRDDLEWMIDHALEIRAVERAQQFLAKADPAQ